MIGKMFFNQQRWHLAVGTVVVIPKIRCVSIQRSWKFCIIATANSWNDQDSNRTNRGWKTLYFCPEVLSFHLIFQVGREWPQRLYNQKRKLLGQIWALQPEVNKAFEKLRYSYSFTADMFLEVLRRTETFFLNYF